MSFVFELNLQLNVFLQRIEPADAHVLEKFLKPEENHCNSKLTNGTSPSESEQ